MRNETTAFLTATAQKKARLPEREVRTASQVGKMEKEMEEKKLTDEVLKGLNDFHDRILKTRIAELILESEIMAIVNAKEVIADQNAEIERLNKCVMSEVQVRKCCEDIIHETIKQTVNDMGKEIYKRVTDSLKMWLRERYDVEVE